MFAVFFSVLLGTIVSLPPSDGQQAYTTACAACHGTHMDGSNNAPTLHGIGMAALDFWLRTGRMPAAAPGVQVGHRDQRNGQRLSPDAIAAIETYLRPIVGPPAIPPVVADGDLARGRALFTLDCAHCHGSSGAGGAIGASNWAPDLRFAPITQVAEAIRTGPGQMPPFDERQISPGDLNDIASYVMTFRRDQPVPPLHSGGPVPEGALGWVAILVLLAFVFVYWRADTPPPDRRDTVRRGSPPHSPKTGPK